MPVINRKTKTVSKKMTRVGGFVSTPFFGPTELLVIQETHMFERIWVFMLLLMIVLRYGQLNFNLIAAG